MKSDLKKHELLKILSIQRRKKNHLGLPFEDILSSMDISKDYLDEISGELYGSDEIKHFQDYQYKKGLHATKEGYSSFSSEKYRRRHFKEKWVLVRNWTATIVAVFTIPFQIYRYMDSKESIKTQQEKQDYELPIVEKQQQTESTQEKEEHIEKSKDSVLSD